MTKEVKWADEAVTALHAGYTPEADDAARSAEVETLMEALSKTKREVVGKLVSEKVYVKPAAKTRKTPIDEGPTKKDLQASLVEAGVNVTGSDGATKEFLKAVVELTVVSTDD